MDRRVLTICLTAIGDSVSLPPKLISGKLPKQHVVFSDAESNGCGRTWFFSHVSLEARINFVPLNWCVTSTKGFTIRRALTGPNRASDRPDSGSGGCRRFGQGTCKLRRSRRGRFRQLGDLPTLNDKSQTARHNERSEKVPTARCGPPHFTDIYHGMTVPGHRTDCRWFSCSLAGKGKSPRTSRGATCPSPL
jgi:hypothetical protein